MRPPRLALVAAFVVVAALFAVDMVADWPPVLVTLYLLGPLLAALAAGPSAAAAVGILAIVLSAIRVSVDGVSEQDGTRVLTVALGSAVAVWVAALRARVQSTAALLDLVFEHAPVGIALLDTQVRYVRVNDRLAAINGVPAAEHPAARSPSCCPICPLVCRRTSSASRAPARR